MERINAQARKVGTLMFSASTGAVYKQMLTLTWDILRETATLLWLVVCLVFVGAEWFYRRSVALGRRARSWYNSLGQTSSDTEARSLSAVGQTMLGAGQAGATFLLTQARRQLDMAEPPASSPEPTATAPTPAPAPSPSPTQGPQSGSAPGAGNPSASGGATSENPGSDADA